VPSGAGGGSRGREWRTETLFAGRFHARGQSEKKEASPGDTNTRPGDIRATVHYWNKLTRKLPRVTPAVHNWRDYQGLTPPDFALRLLDQYPRCHVPHRRPRSRLHQLRRTGRPDRPHDGERYGVSTLFSRFRHGLEHRDDYRWRDRLEKEVVEPRELAAVSETDHSSSARRMAR